MAEPTAPDLHNDPPLFRECVNFTAARTGFNLRLIEKDYFCTVLLARLARAGGGQLVFKGGTCLAKVHASFYRLSEDLDFTIPLPSDASRSQRRSAVAAFKDAVSDIAELIPAFTCTEPLTGANNSTQYNGAVMYESPTTGHQETILVEVSLREPLLAAAVAAEARTLLLDPVDGSPIVAALTIDCISILEAMAEKFRAALSRREVAIRDFYDIDYAASRLSLDLADPQLVDMVGRKLAVPGNPAVIVGADRWTDLRRQLDTRLKTVLRDDDFCAFDLDQAIALVEQMAERFA